MKRRRFLAVAGLGAAGGLLPDWLGALEPNRSLRTTPGSNSPTIPRAGEGETHLVVLHTNDTHSRMDPFPMDGGPNQGLGGAARRATLIRRVRSEHPHVLLLDSGDIFQGTPYFNFFHGELEFEAMSAMEYDVATIGNHDFDNGVDGLAGMMPRATFDLVSANYDVVGSPLEARVQPWVIRELDGVRVGIFGLGVDFEGLVLESLHRGVRHTDPFESARRSVSALRTLGCSLIICLSHLGYRYRGDRPSDTRLAQEVDGIDLILGGHSHTFMDSPDIYSRPSNRQTLVNQVGWGGMRLGRVDVVMAASGRSSSGAAWEPARWAVGGYSVDHSLD